MIDWRDIGHECMKHNDYQHAVVAYAKAGETKLLYNLGDLLMKESNIDLAKVAYYSALKSEPDDVLEKKLELLLDEDDKVKNNGRDPITLKRLDTSINVILKILDERDGIKEAS
jgi:tetratricopeptide (TPR) repeat protein